MSVQTLTLQEAVSKFIPRYRYPGGQTILVDRHKGITDTASFWKAVEMGPVILASHFRKSGGINFALAHRPLQAYAGLYNGKTQHGFEVIAAFSLAKDRITHPERQGKKPKRAAVAFHEGDMVYLRDLCELECFRSPIPTIQRNIKLLDKGIAAIGRANAKARVKGFMERFPNFRDSFPLLTKHGPGG